MSGLRVKISSQRGIFIMQNIMQYYAVLWGILCTKTVKNGLQVKYG